MAVDPVSGFLGWKLTWEGGGAIAGGLIGLGGATYLWRYGYKKAEKLKSVDVVQDKDKIIFDCKVIEKFSYTISDVLSVEADRLAEQIHLAVARFNSGQPSPALDVFRVAAIKAQQMAKDALAANSVIMEQAEQVRGKARPN